MILPKIDFLLPEERTLIGEDVTGVTSDPQLAILVTYKNFIDRIFVPATGIQTPNYTNTTLNSAGAALRAIRNSLPTREVVASDGLYQMGDVRYTFARSDLPILPTLPNREDRIVDNGVTYEVVSWDTDPVEKLWRIVARRMT